MIIPNIMIRILKLLHMPDFLRSASAILLACAYLLGAANVLYKSRKQIRALPVVCAVLLLLGVCKLIPYFDWRDRAAPIELVDTLEVDQHYYDVFFWDGQNYSKEEIQSRIEETTQKHYPLEALDPGKYTYIFSTDRAIAAFYYNVWDSNPTEWFWPFAPIEYYPSIEYKDRQQSRGNFYIYRTILKDFY